MNLSKLAWAAWAIAPVGALAFHYGPGQAIYQSDIAASLQRSAEALEQDARAAQERAHAAHIAAIEARQRAFVLETPEAASEVAAATAAESAAFAEASAVWKRVAQAFGHIHEVAVDASDETLRQVRWSRSRALVRSGEIWEGIGELESVLAEAEEAEGRDSEMALAARQELATAHYYGARLLRLAGEPEDEWLEDSGRARQHFRYLAERARAAGMPQSVVENHERDVELVLNLEQAALYEIEGRPLPKDSPSRCMGNRPNNNKGKRKQPPQNRDGRGAGGAEEIWSGW
ncbi:MAG: hypothetical protein ACF8R7_07565 [Phycisphaerales bacterium JB039]